MSDQKKEKLLNEQQEYKKQAFEYLIGHQKFLKNNEEISELSIKQSKLKNGGNGLFTNVPIPKDNVICFYPAKLIQDLEFPDLFYKDGDEKPFTPEPNTENKNLIYNSDYNIVMYPFRIITDNYIPNNKVYVGHILNDRAYHPDKTYKPHLNNCRYEGMHVVSTRDIKAGEELYITYGKQYWYKDKENEDGEFVPSRHNKIKLNKN